MPCYAPCHTYLESGTPEYARAEEAVKAKLEAVRHIVDYYYDALGHSLPSLDDGTCIDPTRQPRSGREKTIREMICHHFACDGVDFCTLYDVSTLLDEGVRTERAYLAVILPCASLMRSEPERFKPRS